MIAIWLSVVGITGSPVTVDVEVAGGGLYHAAVVLQARMGTTITYEGVPRNIEGIHYLRRSLDAGGFAYDTVEGELVFSYPSDASAAEAVEAAVAVANVHPEAYAKYRVVEQDGVVNIVPTEILTVDGWVAYKPVLDTVVTLPSITGRPTELYHATLAALANTAGVPVYDDRRTLDTWRSAKVTLPSATAPARVLLNQIISQSEYANTWRLLYLFSEENPALGWQVSVNQIQPEHDNLMNRTPLVPVEPKPTSVDPNSDWLNQK
jgi:hypothetical protein